MRTDRRTFTRVLSAATAAALMPWRALAQTVTLKDVVPTAFRIFLKHRDDITRVTFWGVSDGDSWLNRGRVNHPLLWDRQRRPKPAFDDVARVLMMGGKN